MIAIFKSLYVSTQIDLSKFSHLHGLFSCGDGDLVSVFLENLTAISSVLVTIRLGKHLEVVGLDRALVLDLTPLDEAHVNVGA